MYTVDVQAAPDLPRTLLRSAPPRIIRGGRWATRGAGLELDRVGATSGSDGNGRFVGVSVLWAEAGGGADEGWRWETAFRCYQELDMQQYRGFGFSGL
eukprot:SAG11_NODE_2180_length_3714_cov_2.273306_6_plen_98_part_00